MSGVPQAATRFFAPQAICGAIPRHLLIAGRGLQSLQARDSARRAFTTVYPSYAALRPPTPPRCSPPPFSRSFRKSFTSSTRPQSAVEPHFIYHISASYSAKGHKLDPDRNIYNYNPFVRITKTATEIKSGKQDKANRPRSGQDAFFVSQVGETESVSFGVADGVGGWTESGVDPADFAHSLCNYMASASSGYPEDFTSDYLKPRELLQKAYTHVVQDKSVLGGGSTACVATAETDGRLEVANLGDSGFVHLGLGAVRSFSNTQTHAFNTPYQLSKIPQKMLAQMSLFGGSNALCDLPKDANVTHHDLKHGDVLVFATDGVWDNLSTQDAFKIISHYMIASGAWHGTSDGIEVGKKLGTLTRRGEVIKDDQDTLQAMLALAITGEAKEASVNARRDGPFAREVQKYYPGEDWHGGKPDDICVVVAVVVDQNHS